MSRYRLVTKNKRKNKRGQVQQDNKKNVSRGGKETTQELGSATNKGKIADSAKVIGSILFFQLIGIHGYINALKL